MPDTSDESPRGSDSFWHRRRPGIRYVQSVAGIVAGIGLLILFATAPEEKWRLIFGLMLLATGIASIPVFAWMDRRRL